jgi:predicted transcriptional regulator/ribosomal protein S18 acetylase RimI-like enzyme
VTGNSLIDTTLPLFPESEGVQLNGSRLALIRLSDESNLPESALSSFGDLVLGSEDLYPGIDKWFQKKVIPGIRDGKRIAFILFHEGKAIAQTILKFGSTTKMCSMRVDPAYQGRGIGPFLFAQIALELDNSVKRIMFTAPESLVEERSGLFDDLGFAFAGKSRIRYRAGQDELVFQAPVFLFKRQTISLVSKKTAGPNLKDAVPGILLSIKSEYANRILSGEKCIEFRRRFSQEAKGCIALLYATQPVGKVVGDAVVKDVVTDEPDKIWRQFHSFAGTRKDEFDAYCKGTDKVSALILAQVSKYPHPFDWNSVVHAFEGMQRPPQSYQRIPRPSLSFWGSLASSGSSEKDLTEASIGL